MPMQSQRVPTYPDLEVDCELSAKISHRNTRTVQPPQIMEFFDNPKSSDLSSGEGSDREVTRRARSSKGGVIKPIPLAKLLKDKSPGQPTMICSDTDIKQTPFANLHKDKSPGQPYVTCSDTETLNRSEINISPHRKIVPQTDGLKFVGRGQRLSFSPPVSKPNIRSPSPRSQVTDRSTSMFTSDQISPHALHHSSVAPSSQGMFLPDHSTQSPSAIHHSLVSPIHSLSHDSSTYDYKFQTSRHDSSGSESSGSRLSRVMEAVKKSPTLPSHAASDSELLSLSRSNSAVISPMSLGRGRGALVQKLIQNAQSPEGLVELTKKSKTVPKHSHFEPVSEDSDPDLEVIIKRTGNQQNAVYTQHSDSSKNLVDKLLTSDSDSIVQQILGSKNKSAKPTHSLVPPTEQSSQGSMVGKDSGVTMPRARLPKSAHKKTVGQKLSMSLQSTCNEQAIQKSIPDPRTLRPETTGRNLTSPITGADVQSALEQAIAGRTDPGGVTLLGNVTPRAATVDSLAGIRRISSPSQSMMGNPESMRCKRIELR